MSTVTPWSDASGLVFKKTEKSFDHSRKKSVRISNRSLDPIVHREKIQASEMISAEFDRPKTTEKFAKSKSTTDSVEGRGLQEAHSEDRLRKAKSWSSELSSATTLSSVEDIGFCQWQGEYAFPQHGYHGHHFGDAYIETPAPSSPGGEVYHATERGVRRCYIPAKFSSFPFMNKEYDGLPTPAISPPAFEVYTPPYSQASESPLQSPITTPSSSRRSSLDDSLLLENGYGKAVTTSEPSPVLDEFFSLNTSKSCSAILESSHSPSSSRAGNRRRRHRAASLTIPPLPPAPSPRHTSAFSSPPQPWDIRSLPVEGTVRAPSPDVGRLETAADLLYPPRSPIEPLEYCGSYSPSEESLLLPPSSLFLPEQEQECEAIVQAEDKGVTKALSACLRRKKTLSDLQQEPPKRWENPDGDFLPDVPSFKRPSSPAPFGRNQRSAVTATTDQHKIDSTRSFKNLRTPSRA